MAKRTPNTGPQGSGAGGSIGALEVPERGASCCTGFESQQKGRESCAHGTYRECLSAVVGSAAASAALTQSQPPQRPRTQNQVGGPIQASDQGAFAGGHPGAMAQGSANSEVAAYAADSGIELAGRSSVNAHEACRLRGRPSLETQSRRAPHNPYEHPTARPPQGRHSGRAGL